MAMWFELIIGYLKINGNELTKICKHSYINIYIYRHIDGVANLNFLYGFLQDYIKIKKSSLVILEIFYLVNISCRFVLEIKSSSMDISDFTACLLFTRKFCILVPL